MPNRAFMTFAAEPRHELLSNQQRSCVLIFDDPELDPKLREIRTALFDKYVKPCFNLIYKLCWNYSSHPSNVKENYNEVLMNFYRKITTYDTSRPIHTWLHFVTRRYIVKLEQSRSQYDNKGLNVDINNFPDIYPSNTTSVNVTCLDNYHSLYNDDILAALDAMSPNSKIALLLQQDGYSGEEILEIEWQRGTLKRRDINTIRSRIFDARRFLKRYITVDGGRKIN